MFAIRIQTEELMLVYAISKLETGDSGGGTSKGLKTLHSATCRFDRAMVLFSNVIKVFATAYLGVFPIDIFSSQ